LKQFWIYGEAITFLADHVMPALRKAEVHSTARKQSTERATPF
jgi:hypothetical protein